MKINNHSNPLSSRIDMDKVMMVSRMKASAVAGNVMDTVRDETPADMLAGLAVAFATVSERFSHGPEELYHLGRKLLRQEAFEHKANSMSESLRDLVALELNTNTGGLHG